MTTRETDAGRTRIWTKRVVTLVFCWAATWAFTSWLQMRPQPLGLLAAFGVAAAIGWWAHDTSSGWEAVEWTGNPIGRRMKTNADSRISYLRRLLDDASVHGDGGAPNASAASLQGILRDVTVDRLRTRAAANGAAQVPDDDELIAHADPRLAAYLLAQPPPPTTRQTVADIIDRIEAL